jgi:hypothetical protein
MPGTTVAQVLAGSGLFESCLLWELPTKRRHVEVSVHPLAALMPSAGTILIHELILACIAGAVGIRTAAMRASACALKSFHKGEHR